MDQLRFKTVEELYTRVKPALKSKQNEFIKMKCNYIKEEDIWNYLKESIWLNSNELTLFDIVNDILNVSKDEIDIYQKNKLAKENREINLSDIEVI